MSSAYSCTLYDASAPLLSQSFHAPSFPQTGSWSWVGLIDSGVKGAIKVLSRYSAGGIDQYTVIVGQLICTSFRLNGQAMERLKTAIMDLSSMQTMGDMLHFGFGVDSIVRNLAATVEGGTLVALCAAATEAFHRDHAANLFWEMVRTFELPEKRAPSPMQWRALLNACAGTLTGTAFPRRAEHFMQLHAEQNRLSVGREERETPPSSRGVSSPDSMAEALLAIGKVSTGEWLSVSIVGGADAGWLAAVANWIFDLRIAIHDSDGEILHATSQAQHAQVYIHFTTPRQSPSAQAVAIDGHVCTLRDITELFFLQENEFGSGLVCSRVPWTEALSLTFGSEFRRLMELTRSFGSALAAAGRVFQGVIGAEQGISADEKASCKTYFKEGFGQGFSHFAMALFPELRPLGKFVEDTRFKSLKDAMDQYEASRTHIKLGCGCDVCKSGPDKGMFEERFCLALTLETIIIIVQCMSGVTAAPSILPMRSGIEGFYRRQLKLHYHEKFKSRLEEYGAVGAILEFSSAECDEWNIEESVAIPRLIHIAKLFSGRDIESSSNEQVAISMAGIVVFLNSLIEGGLPSSPETAGGCTVMQGHIEVYGRSYTHLEDLSDFDIHGMDYRKQRRSGKALDPLLEPSSLTANFTRMKLVAQEQPSVVKVGLLVQEEHSDPTTAPSALIGPASLGRLVLESTGIVSCDGASCSEIDECTEMLRNEDGCVQLIETPGRTKIWVFRGNDLSRFVALSRIKDIQPLYYTIVQHNECLNCCFKAARLSGFENAIIFRRKRWWLLGKRPREDAAIEDVGIRSHNV